MSNLILKRRKGESVEIGPDIVVTVVEVRGASCRLSISAPRELVVMRPELKSKEAKG